MHVRSVFLSDIHLGTKDSQADRLLEAMKNIECDRLYLVGDIIDGWELKSVWRWAQSHSDVIQKILRRARKGTEVYYILGNHDEFIRPFLPISLGDRIEFHDEIIFEGIDGKRYLVIHGDLFDSVTMTKRWLAILGDKSYIFLLRLNKPINFVRKLFGYKRFWSLSQTAKLSVKKAVNYICDFEYVLCKYAKQKNVDGVICGHIHHAQIKDVDGIKYINCGDWVESCSMIVEHFDGRFEIIDSTNTVL
jgi:UDP-2,3-diacylglucosamine pyrophosphatase LpxH